MSSGRPVVIEARQVRKVYGIERAPIVALQDISFAVEEGSFVSLVGPSGCGKSTLLQILAGLVPSTSGEVLIDGVRVRQPAPEKISVMFQDATLLPWKRVSENVEFPLEIRGMKPAERRQRAAAMLSLVGLAEFAERYPHELSGGMRQRVSIARALAPDPRIMLMDEPFGALDEQTRIKMGHELLHIWEKTGKTIFFITHSLTEALFLADIVLVMSHRPGRIVGTIKADLPRPRTYEIIGSAAFGSTRNRIWKLISQGDRELSREGMASL
ncbi:MAG TPA: ABC transporter ATP-binding protein [Xanthobacteraceae bacterium]|jgi:NitT/TauT family transport system ATP-binding protein